MTVALLPLLDYVGSTFTPPTVRLDAWNEDPNTGEPVAQQVATDPVQLERALSQAQRAYDDGALTALSVDERAAALDRIADLLEPRMTAIAEQEALTTGVVVSMTSMLAVIVPGSFRLAAEQLRSGSTLTTLDGPNGNPVEVHRKPHGVAALLVPWNAPAPMAAHKVANALAAGCPTILKPSEFAPNGCRIIAEAIAEAGLPAGAFALVNGGPEVGQALVGDPRVRAISYTGGIVGGRAIAAAAAPEFKPAQLELGGNNPVIVLDDADLEAAAAGVVALLTQLNGQWCRALGRLLVAADLRDELLDRVFELLAGVRVGDSLDPGSQMGPMISSLHLSRLQARIDTLRGKGGKAHSTTAVPERGSFLAPTLITGVDPSDVIDEIFGPVGTVHTFATDAEAVALANAVPCGLEGYVFTGDDERGMQIGRQLRRGGVKVNGATVLSLSLMAPRPQWGLSGITDEGTVETFQFFLGTQVVGVEGTQT